MNNKQKARELAIKCSKTTDVNGNEVYNVFCEAALQEMAEWKDKQYHDLIKQSNENSTRQFELGCEKERDRIIEKVYQLLVEKYFFTEDEAKDFKKAMEE